MDFVSLQPGDVINDKYELLDQLGAGAFGAVFRARQLGIDRIVAIKCLLSEAGAVDETAIERFKREARLSSALEHPNTITIHDYGQTESGVLYLVMEYVRGVTLKTMLKNEQRLQPSRAVRIVKQVLSSLHEAHSRGIVHRDMKPANIMLFNRLGDKDVIKVLDFGIAKFVSDDGQAMGSAKDDLTVAGRIVGTPRYMAPEQINGKGAFPASDIYALGLMFYEMLTGRQAVSGDSTLTLIAQQISNAPVIDPNSPLIPEPLRPILIRSTAKNMLERYQTAADFMGDLEKLDPAALDRLIDPSLPAPDRSVSPTQTGEFRQAERDSSSGSRQLPQTPAASSSARFGILAAVVLLVVGLGIIGTLLVLGGDEAAQTPSGALAATSVPSSAPASTPAPPASAEPAASAPLDPPEDNLKMEDAPAARTVTIESEPAGAEVLHNGAAIGLTPLPVNVAPDQAPAAYELALKGYEKQTIDISPASEDVVRVSLKVEPAVAPVQRPRTAPAGNTNNKNSNSKTGNGGNGGNGGSKNDYEVF